MRFGVASLALLLGLVLAGCSGAAHPALTQAQADAACATKTLPWSARQSALADRVAIVANATDVAEANAIRSGLMSIHCDALARDWLSLDQQGVSVYADAVRLSARATQTGDSMVANQASARFARATTLLHQSAVILSSH